MTSYSLMTETPGDLALAVPPSSIGNTLLTFTKASRDSQGTLNSLLQTPFLQEIRIPSATDGLTTIYPIISDTVAKLAAVQVIDVGIARQLLGYARTFPLLAGVMPRGQVASSLSQLVVRYVQEANIKSVDSKKFFASFQSTIDTVLTTVTTLDRDIARTKEQIMELEEQLENAANPADTDVLTILREGMGKYFDTMSHSGLSFFAGLAEVFKMTVEDVQDMIRRSNEIAELKRLIQQLEGFQKRVSAVRTSLTNLGESMTTLMRASVSIMSVWFQINQNLQTLAVSPNAAEKFSETDVELLKMTWKDVYERAETFTKEISDVSATTVNSLMVENKRCVSQAVSRATQRLANNKKSVSPEEDAIDKLKPDPQIAKALQDMTEKSGKIVAGFNDLLRTPFLDSLKVSSSAVSGSSDDGSRTDGEDNGIDLETLTLTYLQRYQKLQADTIPVARDLYGYAMLQQNLLPMLEKQVPITTYLDANVKIIAGYREAASKLHALHNKFQQDWNIAINMVIRAIEEQKSGMVGLEQQITDLVKQKRDITIGAAFAIIGAIVFTAAAFLTGGLVMMAFAGLALGTAVAAGMLISNIVQMNAAISGFRQALETAKQTVKKLETVLPMMQEIQDLLATVTLVWNAITNKLVAIQTNVDSWLFLIGPALDTLVGFAIADWKEVSESVLEYVAVVSDVNPLA